MKGWWGRYWWAVVGAMLSLALAILFPELTELD
jgi:hypothetical protein